MGRLNPIAFIVLFVNHVEIPVLLSVFQINYVPVGSGNYLFGVIKSLQRELKKNCFGTIYLFAQSARQRVHL